MNGVAGENDRQALLCYVRLVAVAPSMPEASMACVPVPGAECLLLKSSGVRTFQKLNQPGRPEWFLKQRCG